MGDARKSRVYAERRCVPSQAWAIHVSPLSAPAPPFPWECMTGAGRRTSRTHDRDGRKEDEDLARKAMAHLRRLRGEDKAAFFRGLQRDGVANAWHYNAMISATVDPDRARTLLAEMRSAGVKPDVVTFTSLITLEMRRGRWQVAEAYMRELGTEGLRPNERTFGALVEGYGKHGTVQMALGALARMEAAGVPPNEVVLGSVIDACAKHGDARAAEEVLARLAAAPSPVRPNKHVYTSLMDLHARCGSAEGVRRVWDEMLAAGTELDTNLFNMRLACLDKTGALDDVHAAFGEAAALGVEPDVATYTTVINAMAQRGLVGEARRLFEQTREALGADATLYCVLIDALCKAPPARLPLPRPLRAPAPWRAAQRRRGCPLPT
jgi:pentatricopeptide repeat protein